MSEQTLNRLDQEDLARLAQFHKIFAYIVGFSSLCGCPHFTIGIFMLVGPDLGETSTPHPLLGIFFMLAGLVVIAGFSTLCYYNFKVSEAISLRSNPTMITIVSCFNFLFQPIGTAMGVYSLIIMSRPSVRSLFHPGMTVTVPQSEADRPPTEPPTT